MLSRMAEAMSSCIGSRSAAGTPTISPSSSTPTRIVPEWKEAKRRDSLEEGPLVFLLGGDGPLELDVLTLAACDQHFQIRAGLLENNGVVPVAGDEAVEVAHIQPVIVGAQHDQRVRLDPARCL